MPEPEPELEEEREQDAASSSLPRADSSQLCKTCSACELCAHLEVAPPPTPVHLSPMTPGARTFSRTVSSAASPFNLAGSMSLEGLDELIHTSTRPPQTPGQRAKQRGAPTDSAQRQADSTMRGLRKNQRSVESTIFAEDLTATWDDQQINGPDCDWRTCLVSAPTWDKLDDRTRLELRRNAQKRAKEKAEAVQAERANEKLQRALSADQKEAAEAEAAAKAAERAELAQRSDLFDSVVAEPADEDEDDDLGRSESLVSVASSGASSSGGGVLFGGGIESALKDAGAETRSGSAGANGVVLRAQWKGSVKVAIKVALESPEAIKQ